jgi:hypothetical protein
VTSGAGRTGAAAVASVVIADDYGWVATAVLSDCASNQCVNLLLYGIKLFQESK